MRKSAQIMPPEQARRAYGASWLSCLVLSACAATGATAEPAAPAGATPSVGPDASAPAQVSAEPATAASPGEASPPVVSEGSEATARPEPTPPPPPPPSPPQVELSESKFVGQGEVPKVDVYLRKTLGDVGLCVAKHGGLTATPGHIEIQLLVRDRGRAEGVEVLGRKGVAEAATRCVADLLRGKWVGSPTADPVGVTFRYELTDGG